MTLYTQREAALVLRLSERTLERMRTLGNGVPFIRAGRRSVKYRQSDIDEWIKGRVVRSTSEVVGRAVR